MYTYRDIWPLGTLTETPLDIAEGWMLWARIALLALTGIVIPVVSPHRYVPFNPRVPHSCTFASEAHRTRSGTSQSRESRASGVMVVFSDLVDYGSNHPERDADDTYPGRGVLPAGGHGYGQKSEVHKLSPPGYFQEQLETSYLLGIYESIPCVSALVDSPRSTYLDFTGKEYTSFALLTILRVSTH